MAEFVCFYETNLPDSMVDEICSYGETLQLFKSQLISTPSNSEFPPDEITKWRNSENQFINFRESWIPAFIWNYVEHANRTNFRYDIIGLDKENVQYTSYSTGMYYKWHTDHDISMMSSPDYVASSSQTAGALESHISAENSRKLSFSLQLSNEDEYEGGELQFLGTHGLYTAKKSRGKLLVFDSRVAHRVRRVKSGVRKSLVGWAIGPRWR